LKIRTTHRNEYTISTDKDKLDIVSIHKFLANETDWANKIPIETLKKSIENSLDFGLYYKNKQIGFARIISDYSTIAYLGDVYILEAHRGNGLSKWLLNEMLSTNMVNNSPLFTFEIFLILIPLQLPNT